MPKVPYQPFATESPSGARTPNVNAHIPDINPAAFGGTVAAGISHLGDTVEKAGGEIFQRAMALQQLANETEATDADSRYMELTGKRHAEYSAKQGKDAVDAYPAYIAGMKADRQEVRDSLSNPMAQKMYDRSSLSTMGRSIFNGAGHAATQQKQWSIKSAKDQMELDAQTIEDNPNDPKLFEAKLRRVEAGARQVNELSGLGSSGPSAELNILKETSKLYASKVIGASRTDPSLAEQMLQEYTDKKVLTEADKQRLETIVMGKATAVASANIARGVIQAHRKPDGSGYDISQTEMDELVEKEAAKSKNPLLARHAIGELHTQLYQERVSKTQFDHENMLSIKDTADKLNISSMQQLLAVPGMDKTVAALPADKRADLNGYLYRSQMNKNHVSNQASALRLDGLMRNDRDAFLNTDMSKEGLSYQDQRAFEKLQDKIKNTPNADTRVNKAQEVIKGAMGEQLKALEIFKRTDSNDKAFDLYTGALSAALDDWAANHNGRRPTNEEIITKIAPDVLRMRQDPGTWYGTNAAPFFQQPGTEPKNIQRFEEFKTQLNADLKAADAPPATDAQVTRLWARQELMRLHKTKESK